MGKHVRPKNESFTIAFESRKEAEDASGASEGVLCEEGYLEPCSEFQYATFVEGSDGFVPAEGYIGQPDAFNQEIPYAPGDAFAPQMPYMNDGFNTLNEEYAPYDEVAPEIQYLPVYGQEADAVYEQLASNDYGSDYPGDYADGYPSPMLGDFQDPNTYEAAPLNISPAENPHALKAKKRRRKLALIIAALIVVVIGIAAGGVLIFMNTQQNASDTAKSASTEGQLTANTDSKTTSGMQVEVPNVVEYIETSLEHTLEHIGHGAELYASYEIDTKEAKYHTEKTIQLTADAKDEKFGYPEVYLSYNWSGSIIRTGYSATISQLGYGVISLDELVNNQHAVEKTLNGIGFEVEEGTISLPTDKSTYQTFDANGKLSREMVDFTGKAKTTTGKTYIWEAAVMYDYTTSNATSNLADTLRQIYVYCLEY